MASTSCWRCLLRPAQPLPLRLVACPRPIIAPLAAIPSAASSRSFSTTIPPHADNSSALGRHIRGGKMSAGQSKKKKRKGQKEKLRVPKIGERKAFRKRIQLSNNNAIPVRGHKLLSAATMADPESAGRVLAIPDDPLIDQLRACRAFKVTQTWGLFHSPHTLVRAETVELCQRMNKAAEEKETMKLVLTGDRLCGKSMLLLQTLANAYLNNWIVINVPDAQELTTACTDYAPNTGGSPIPWRQPSFILNLMQSLQKSNGKLLSKLVTVGSYEHLANPVRTAMPLNTLIDSAKELDHAFPVWEALWTELTVKGHDRPPILFALDGIAHVMKMSAYRDQAFNPIHAHDLAFVRTFVDLLSGTTNFANGGAVIAADSRSNSPRSPSTELAILQRLAVQEDGGADGVTRPQKAPYAKGFDARVDAAMAKVEVMEVKGISKTDARALMEYWAASGLMRTVIDERTVADKWTLSGGGVVGEMERSALLSPLNI